MPPHTASLEQIDTLLDFLGEHRDLARGKLRNIEGKVQAKRLWKELSKTLNSMGGCTKTIRQWQKVWFDRKHLAKKAAADYQTTVLATGDTPMKALSRSELKVLSIIGDGLGEFQIGARIPPFNGSHEPIQSTSSPQSSPPSISQPQVIDFSKCNVEYLVPIEDSHPMQLSPDESQTTSRRHFSTRRPKRRAANDIRKLLELEKGRVDREIARNTELAGIRSVLEQLYGLLSERLKA